MERLESNSITTGAKATKKKPTKVEERQKIEKVVKNRVTTQKKSLSQKFGETFLSDESGGVGSYIFNDVLIPALKDTFVDMVEGAINMAFYGDTRRRSRGRSSFSRGGVERVSYEDRFDSRSRRKSAPRGRARYEMDNLRFDTRADADALLDTLTEYLDQYDSVSVGDVFESLDIPTQANDFRYGWYELGGAHIRRSRDGGYVLEMPRLEEID